MTSNQLAQVKTDAVVVDKSSGNRGCGSVSARQTILPKTSGTRFDLGVDLLTDLQIQFGY